MCDDYHEIRLFVKNKDVYSFAYLYALQNKLISDSNPHVLCANRFIRFFCASLMRVAHRRDVQALVGHWKASCKGDNSRVLFVAQDLRVCA